MTESSSSYPKNPWFITWSDKGTAHSLSFPTGDEAYRMAGAIADRLKKHVSVFPPSDGEIVQPSFQVAPNLG